MKQEEKLLTIFYIKNII